MEAREIALSQARGRMVVGAALLLAPGWAGRRWIGEPAGHPAVKVLTRALGVRDLAIGLGAVIALDRGVPARGWFEGGGALRHRRPARDAGWPGNAIPHRRPQGRGDDRGRVGGRVRGARSRGGRAAGRGCPRARGGAHRPPLVAGPCRNPYGGQRSARWGSGAVPPSSARAIRPGSRLAWLGDALSSARLAAVRSCSRARRRLPRGSAMSRTPVRCRPATALEHVEDAVFQARAPRDADGARGRRRTRAATRPRTATRSRSRPRPPTASTRSPTRSSSTSSPRACTAPSWAA